MKTKTKQLFVAVLAGMASNYGVASMSEQFNVEPSTDPRLYDASV
ncbi:hypothetical protein [Pseudoalteromonas sp. S1731]|nr:hypothetical protein [Pseudoalteromonas sp. S1731]